MADRPPPPTEGDDESTIGAPDAIEAVREAVRKARANTAPQTSTVAVSPAATDQRWRPSPRPPARPEVVARPAGPFERDVAPTVAPPMGPASAPVIPTTADPPAPAAPRAPRDRRWSAVAMIAIGVIVLGGIVGWIVARTTEDDDAPSRPTTVTTVVAETAGSAPTTSAVAAP